MIITKFPEYAKSFCRIFIIIMFTSAATFSQGKIKINSVEEAILYSKKNNSEIITAYLDKLKAEKKVSEVYSENLIPNITLNSRYTRSFKKQVFDIAGQRFEVGADNTIINTIDANLSLPVLGTPVFSGLRIADYYDKVQEENILAVENNVKTNVKEAYYGVLLAKSVVDVNRLTLETAQENFNVVESKYKNGVATEFDYLRARVRVDNSVPELSKSERNYEVSIKALINAIGFKSVQDIDVEGELTYDSLEVWESTDYMINKISENYVTVRQLRINKKINEELVRVDRANYLPKLYIFGQFNLNSQESDTRRVTDYRFFNTSNAGLGLSWDLNLFRNTYRVNQSEIEVKKSTEQIKDVKQKLKLLSQSAIIVLEDAKERIITQKKTLGLAERSLELANASYKAGVLNQIDVQAAELSLSQSRLSYLQAIYDYQVAKAELEKLLEK